MTHVPAAAQTLARHILLHEVEGNPEPDRLTEAAERVEARLRGRLSEVVGLIGYTTLIARAVRLAQAEMPALKNIAVNVEGKGLQGVRDFVEAAGADGKDPNAAEDGLEAILGGVIGLLALFIGEDMAIRLVREEWPELSHDQDASERES